MLAIAGNVVPPLSPKWICPNMYKMPLYFALHHVGYKSTLLPVQWTLTLKNGCGNGISIVLKRGSKLPDNNFNFFAEDMSNHIPGNAAYIKRKAVSKTSLITFFFKCPSDPTNKIVL